MTKIFLLIIALATAGTAAFWSASSPAPLTRTAISPPQKYSYGTDTKQQLDLYPADSRKKAPVIIFVHGGAWRAGDKSRGGYEKAAFYNELGYAVVMLNYRLVPNVTPAEQAQDIADATGWLRKEATKLRIDPDRLVLMGHSAGAHLVALVSTDSSYLAKAGVPLSSLKGAILLDSAAYDVSQKIASGVRPQMRKIYSEAFGDDPNTHRKLSPASHAAEPNVARWLILHIARRDDAKSQSQNLGKLLRQNGAMANVVSVAGSTHMSIKQEAAEKGTDAAKEIQAFLKSL